MVSSDSSSKRLGVERSEGVSLYPSGIQMFVTAGVPNSLPKYSPILRLAMQCSTQNLRISASRCASVNPSADLGCEKQVGLKSTPCPFALAQSFHAAKCRGSIAL